MDKAFRHSTRAHEIATFLAFHYSKVSLSVDITQLREHAYTLQQEIDAAVEKFAQAAAESIKKSTPHLKTPVEEFAKPIYDYLIEDTHLTSVNQLVGRRK